MKRMLCLLMLFSGMLSACSNNFSSQLNFNPSEPIRVAVVPFIMLDARGTPIEGRDALLVDQLKLISEELSETPPQLIRRLVQNELQKSALDLVSPALIDSRLSHTGFAREDLSFDTPKIHSVPAQELCRQILHCDAVLYGTLSRWERNYYGVQSVSSIAFSLKLVSARDGSVLFQSNASDSDTRGISKVPTGISDLIIEPIRGLDSEIISDLARSMVQKSLQTFYIKNRPEFLEMPPPSIFASAHDAQTGRIAKSLKVLMLGSAGLNASFSIDGIIESHPMAEREPGHYIGEYFPLENEHFENRFIAVHLSDQFGRSSSQILGKTSVSY